MRTAPAGLGSERALKLRTKLSLGILGPVLLGFACLYVVTNWLLRAGTAEQETWARNLLEEDAIHSLSGRVDVAWSALRTCYDAHKEEPQRSAQKVCAEMIRAMRFGKSDKGYFWIHTLDPSRPTSVTMVMHPVLTDLTGQDVSDFVDKRRFDKVSFQGKVYRTTSAEVRDLPAVNLFHDMNAAILASSSDSAVVRYFWPEPSRPKDVGYPKISYVHLFRPWGWVVGTGEYVDNIDTAVAVEKEAIDSHAASLTRAIGLMAVLLLGILAIVSYLFVRSIVGPLEEIASAARTMATGDLGAHLAHVSNDEVGQVADAFRSMAAAQRAKAKLAGAIARGDLASEVELASDRDELGHAFMMMSRQLRETVRSIQEAFGQVARGSSEIDDASRTLSDGATRQAAAIEEISSSVTEIASQAKASAENASQAERLVGATREAAVRGDREMRSMVDAMNAISDSNREVSNIIKTIEDIAFQTNLLALNAAVEAARAGQHGKGFAVVAGEVRTLAGKSADAAQRTVDLIRAATDRVKAGLGVAQTTAQTFDDIAQNVGKVASLVGEIAAASREQAQGFEQVSQGLGQIDSVTQHNTSSATETAAASSELATNAMRVRDLLRRFRFSAEGTDSAEDEGPPPLPDTTRAGRGLADASPARAPHARARGA